MSAYDIILKPVITEGSMDATQEKKYTFKVAVNANKTEIKKECLVFGILFFCRPLTTVSSDRDTVLLSKGRIKARDRAITNRIRDFFHRTIGRKQ